MHLVRGLTLPATMALVVGTVIGTGVFIKTAIMAQDTGSAAVVLLAWIAAGVLSMCGALTYAELGAMLPHAGGEYVYLRHAYGELAAFLFGWMRFVVGRNGIDRHSRRRLRDVSLGHRPDDVRVGQLALHAARADDRLAVRIEAGRRRRRDHVLRRDQLPDGGVRRPGAVVAHRSEARRHRRGHRRRVRRFGHGRLVTSRRDGHGEQQWRVGVRSRHARGAVGLRRLEQHADGGRRGEGPGRNVPFALIGGMAVVMLIYCTANLAYFYALPFGDVVTANSTRYREALPVATKAAQTVFGDGGGRLISLAFIFSALGALNGATLTGARVPYAMARDGVFFSKVGVLSQRTRVPVYALLLQAAWASGLAISGTFDQLSDYVIFASWIFYGLVTSSVFVLRRKMPDAPRPYERWVIRSCRWSFVLVAAWLVVNTLVNRPVESVAGLVADRAGPPPLLLLTGSRLLCSVASSFVEQANIGFIAKAPVARVSGDFVKDARSRRAGARSGSRRERRSESGPAPDLR